MAVSEYNMVRVLKFVLSRADGLVLRKFAKAVDDRLHLKLTGQKRKRKKTKKVLLHFRAIQHFVQIVASRRFSPHFMRHAMLTLSEQESLLVVKIVTELIMNQTPSALGGDVALGPGTDRKPSIEQLLEFMSIILDSNFTHLTSLAGKGESNNKYSVLRSQLNNLLETVKGEIDFLSQWSELKQVLLGLQTLNTTKVGNNDVSEYSIETIFTENMS